MASSHITSWQIEGDRVDTVTDFLFLGSKITVDGDCSHEIRRQLLLDQKAMTNLDSVLESKAITLPTKVCVVKAVVFLVLMFGCENWTIKKAEHQSLCPLVLKKTPENSLDSKETKTVSLRGNQL